MAGLRLSARTRRAAPARTGREHHRALPTLRPRSTADRCRAPPHRRRNPTMIIADPDELTRLVHDRLPDDWGERFTNITNNAVSLRLPWHDRFAGTESGGTTTRPVVPGPITMGVADTAMYGCCLVAAATNEAGPSGSGRDLVEVTAVRQQRPRRRRFRWPPSCRGHATIDRRAARPSARAQRERRGRPAPTRRHRIRAVGSVVASLRDLRGVRSRSSHGVAQKRHIEKLVAAVLDNGA